MACTVILMPRFLLEKSGEFIILLFKSGYYSGICSKSYVLFLCKGSNFGF